MNTLNTQQVEKLAKINGNITFDAMVELAKTQGFGYDAPVVIDIASQLDAMTEKVASKDANGLTVATSLDDLFKSSLSMAKLYKSINALRQENDKPLSIKSKLAKPTLHTLSLATMRKDANGAVISLSPYAISDSSQWVSSQVAGSTWFDMTVMVKELATELDVDASVSRVRLTLALIAWFKGYATTSQSAETESRQVAKKAPTKSVPARHSVDAPKDDAQAKAIGLLKSYNAFLNDGTVDSNVTALVRGQVAWQSKKAGVIDSRSRQALAVDNANGDLGDSYRKAIKVAIKSGVVNNVATVIFESRDFSGLVFVNARQGIESTGKAYPCEANPLYTGKFFTKKDRVSVLVEASKVASTMRKEAQQANKS